MVIERLFYSPKDVATIFDMSVRQVYSHAHRKSPGFPQAKFIGEGRKRTIRFCIQETMLCASKWRNEE